MHGGLAVWSIAPSFGKSAANSATEAIEIVTFVTKSMFFLSPNHV